MKATTPRTDRHEAICDAVYDLLGEVGYDRMTMDAVAARARASKATIYRAWPAKPDLVMTAMIHRFGEPPTAPDTGTLRGDLIAQLSNACALASSPDGAIVAGLLTAASHNADLSTVLRRCMYENKHSSYEVIIRRAVGRGEIPDGTDSDLLHEIMHALVLTRRMFDAGPLDDAFVTRIVDRVLLPVLRQGS